MLNRVILIGRLVRDPDSRVTSTGIPHCRFTIAVDRPGKRGEQNTADFIRVVAWRRLAEICGQYLKKGKLVAIVGRLQIDSYQKDGETKESADVIADEMQMLDRGTSVEFEVPAVMEG